MTYPLIPENTRRLVEEIKQSGPVDTSAPYDASRVSGKTILITGGASGLGAAFARRWAELGANLVIGDVNLARGEALVAELRQSTGSSHHHFQHCDVTDWQSQVELFQAAVRVSPTGGVDVVVPNAGIADYRTPPSGVGFEDPAGLDADHPPPPNLKVLDVNILGVFYTVHLALYWLPRNGTGRDRHILLIGSVAGLAPLAGQTQYVASKHAVTGLFRTLRATSWRQSTRVNMICPYFVDTGISPAVGLILLAGIGTVPIGDVIDAATRLVADEGIVGRALMIGPRVRVVDLDNGETRVQKVDGDSPENSHYGIWECYAHDYDTVDPMVWRYTRILNTVEYINGWARKVRDVLWVLFFRKNPRSFVARPKQG